MSLQTLEKNEVKVIAKTKKQYAKEVELSERAFEILLSFFKIIIEKDAVGKYSFSRYSFLILSYRMFRILRCAYNSIMKGYYEVAMGLLRFCFETHLLMNYLSTREDEAKKWLEGKSFTPAYLRKNVKPQYDEVYGQLSKFVHPYMTTSISWYFKEIGKGVQFWIAEFDHQKSLWDLYSLLFMQWGTLVFIPVIFLKAFVGEEDKLKQLKEWVTQFKTIKEEIVKALNST